MGAVGRSCGQHLGGLAETSSTRLWHFKGWARAVKALCPADHGVAANVLGRDQQSLFATTPWDSQHAATAAFPGSQGLNVW